ncbi:excinuclease ABC subunit UvrA [Jeotgalibacillus proteolyticus]|uniref:UvrABC system protein A n=1 Tax=Jeotgalibacillus proteolyticus TaxID=2082395 RepID=A0A2S5GDL9_9BACL|nr:excinuclease ABC subunit UvrA [Jeotgalibacillus proteolyticus]PPA71004.1 excinuclease ABC subunit A [Jeotgalibacillus proteolyticus]
MHNSIILNGARENNLKNISLSIPKHQLVVLTGPSGSGKSTLAMDTLQRECQRQYLESIGMSAESIGKPKVDSIIGLSPSISVGQHNNNRNPRSTVGTITDMYTYLRLIFEKLGERPCPQCHTLILPSLDQEDYNEETGFTQYIHCPDCDYKMEKLTRSHFSFNRPDGACPSCDGLGSVAELDESQLFNPDLSLTEGAVTIWNGAFSDYQLGIVKAAGVHYGIDINLHKKLREFSDAERDLLYYGVESEKFTVHSPDTKPPKTVSKGKFEGVVTAVWRRYREKEGQSGESKLFFTKTCPSCNGSKLNEISRNVKVADVFITDAMKYSLEDFDTWLTRLKTELPESSMLLVEDFLSELSVKVKRILHVGLGYLSLDRQTITLSGGEAQRLRLATILGSGLTGVLYVLDEPTAGLHPKDTQGLVTILKELRDLGNTVLVIEHDTDVMKEADHIIDMGPGAGNYGGTVVGQGSYTELQEQEASITGKYLKEAPPVRQKRRKGNGKHLTVHNATRHNLQNVTVSFPLECFVAVTGVSGSGKSSLVFDLLAHYTQKGRVEGCEKVSGFEEIENIITVNQSPLTRMQRSNVATYTDVFTLIRNVFASLPGAKNAGLKPKDFSFNTVGGRCEHCQGLGFVLTNMHFLPDLEVQCPVCRGKRFKDEVLAVEYKGHSISAILNLTVEESLFIFNDNKKIKPIIELLCEIGLGYLNWGQSVTTLSGGEGQRLKLSKELYKHSADHTLYLLDEPSTGLHPADVKQLLLLLNRLVEAGNTVIIVEHNSDVIRQADWVIDLGPEGGNAGGEVMAEGTPEEVSLVSASYTGAFLTFS